MLPAWQASVSNHGVHGDHGNHGEELCHVRSEIRDHTSETFRVLRGCLFIACPKRQQRRPDQRIARRRFEEGKAKIPGTAEIVHSVIVKLNVTNNLVGKRVLVTGGPTRAYLDAFRYITNPSSGKMGVAIVYAGVRYIEPFVSGGSVDN